MFICCYFYFIISSPKESAQNRHDELNSRFNDPAYRDATLIRQSQAAAITSTSSSSKLIQDWSAKVIDESPRVMIPPHRNTGMPLASCVD